MNLTGVYTVGAVIDMVGVSGTCMFVPRPYSDSPAVTIPLLMVNRFGAGLGVFIPYVVIGLFPMCFSDWLKDHSVLSAWAAFVFAPSGFVIGFGLDLVCLLTDRLSQRWRAITVGAAVQAMTFVVMLVGLSYLYLPNSSVTSHRSLLDQKWFFTLPWMLVSGAFGGYTAYALVKQV